MLKSLVFTLDSFPGSNIITYLIIQSSVFNETRNISIVMSVLGGINLTNILKKSIS